MTRDALGRAFEARFGTWPRFSRAPGRLNLVGEHTDYNEGFVLPVAIERATVVAFASRPGRRIVVRSTAFPEDEAALSLDGPVEPRGDWCDYVRGVLRELRSQGIVVPPAALWIDGTLPLGGGLSSSASLEVASARAMLALAGRSLPLPEVALACQRAENEFVGARCGFMDQLTSCLARPGHALRIDCRSREIEYVPWPSSLGIVVLSSGVRHDVAAGEYNRRRAECDAAAAVLARRFSGVRSLRDVDDARLERARCDLSDVEYRRARHVVSENARVLEFVAAIRSGDFERLGPILAASHESLRFDFEVTCPEVDRLVDLARRQPALVGARMTGAGFGGCTVNLVRAGREEEFLRAVDAEAGPRVGATRGWVTRAAGPARVE